MPTILQSTLSLWPRVLVAVSLLSAGFAEAAPDYKTFSGQYICGRGANGQPMTRFSLDGETGSLQVQGLAGNYTSGVATRRYAPSEGYVRYTLMMSQRDMIIIRFDLRRSGASRPDLLLPGPFSRLACTKEA